MCVLSETDISSQVNIYQCAYIRSVQPWGPEEEEEEEEEEQRGVRGVKCYQRRIIKIYRDNEIGNNIIDSNDTNRIFSLVIINTSTIFICFDNPDPCLLRVRLAVSFFC